MQSIAARVLAFAGAVSGAAAGAHAPAPVAIGAPLPGPAAVADVASPSPAACRDALDGRVIARSSNGSVHRVTIVVSRRGDACLLDGSPTVVAANATSGATIAPSLPAGYLSVPQAEMVGGGATAAFEMRYVAGTASDDTCALAFRFDGVPLNMRPVHLHGCARPSEIDLSSLAPGDAPPSAATEPDRSAFDNVMPCKATDFSVRAIDAASAPPVERDRYALQNRGANACRTAGSIVVRFLDKSGAPLDERFAVRTEMPLDLVIPRGREASFALTFASDGEACSGASTLAIAFENPNSGAADIAIKAAPCRTNAVPIVVSNLVLGVPLDGAMTGATR